MFTFVRQETTEQMIFKVQQDAVLYAKGRSRFGETWVVIQVGTDFHTENTSLPVIGKGNKLIAMYKDFVKIL